LISDHNRSFGNIETLIGMCFEIFFYFFGGFVMLDNYSKNIASSLLGEALFFRILIFVILRSIVLGLILDVPFEIYKTFVIEEKYGFNKTTPKTFILDTFKSWMLTLIFAPAIYWGAVWIIQVGGQYLFYYLTIFGVFLIIFMMMIWPSYIAPLFNKFVKLGEGDEAPERDIVLRKKIIKIADEIKFPVNEIYKVDGSKRSAHSNAYFFGIFKKKRIVIYDTLINQCNDEEIEAILYHELGHWFFSHNVHMLLMSIGQFILIAFWINLFIFNKKVYTEFGLDSNDYFQGLSLTMFTVGPVR